MNEYTKKSAIGLAVLGIGAIIVLAILLVGWPYYNVWSSEMAGKAAFQKATQDRNIMILEATAKEQAAKHNYNTTIIDAQAHADSIAIIGERLEEYPDYLVYMWIQDTGDAGDETYIYVPSGDLGMPILEANRLKSQSTTETATA
jgi:hypothetical protein